MFTTIPAIHDLLKNHYYIYKTHLYVYSRRYSSETEKYPDDRGFSYKMQLFMWAWHKVIVLPCP